MALGLACEHRCTEWSSVTLPGPVPAALVAAHHAGRLPAGRATLSSADRLMGLQDLTHTQTASVTHLQATLGQAAQAIAQLGASHSQAADSAEE